MRITSKGQVTIPAKIREAAGLLPHTEVEFVFDGETVKIVPATGKKSRGAAVLSRLGGSASARMSTDEIMALTRN